MEICTYARIILTHAESHLLQPAKENGKMAVINAFAAAAAVHVFSSSFDIFFRIFAFENDLAIQYMYTLCIQISFAARIPLSQPARELCVCARLYMVFVFYIWNMAWLYVRAKYNKRVETIQTFFHHIHIA